MSLVHFAVQTCGHIRESKSGRLWACCQPEHQDDEHYYMDMSEPEDVRDQ